MTSLINKWRKRTAIDGEKSIGSKIWYLSAAQVGIHAIFGLIIRWMGFGGVTALQMSSNSDSTYWDGKAPESKVLGPWLQNVPSTVLGPLSIVSLAVGVYFAHDHNIFHTMTVDTIDYKVSRGKG